jgi:hypothetical protein
VEAQLEFRNEEVVTVQQGIAQRLRTGWFVFVGLAILTGLEYWIATTWGGSTIAYLAVLALLKAALVVQYFMHVGRVLSAEEE